MHVERTQTPPNPTGHVVWYLPRVQPHSGALEGMEQLHPGAGHSAWTSSLPNSFAEGDTHPEQKAST